MANQTKMIIITSDEDIIRQFAFNKNENTHIINLDNEKQIITTDKDNNDINSDLLAQLSELNSIDDQVYKRALDSFDQNPSKPVKVPKKSDDIICTICGDRAIGFNYNALSCASCKAFFRRNANQPPGRLRCFTSQGQCSVEFGTRRKCPKCRLDRCFSMGMRKDFLVTKEQKQQRQQRLEENRNMALTRLSTSESASSSSTSQSVSNLDYVSPTLDELDRLLMDMNNVADNIDLLENIDSNEIEDTLFDTLSIEDWITIQSVQSSFLSAFQSPTGEYTHHLDLSDRTSALNSWSESANKTALDCINFFRQINEFEALDADDRFILIKYNLFPIFPVSKCFYYKHTNDGSSSGGVGDVEKSRRFFILLGAVNKNGDTFRNLVIPLIQITEQDPTILSLLLTILIFTQGLSMNENEPPLKDSLAVSRAQSHYTKVLWNYLVNKWGEMQACRHFTQLLNMIFEIQSESKKKQEFLRNQLTASDSVDKIAPLLQTILHIS